MLSDFHKEILLAALRSNLDTEFWIHDEIERKYKLDQSHPDYKMVYEFLESSEFSQYPDYGDHNYLVCPVSFALFSCWVPKGRLVSRRRSGLGLYEKDYG